MKYKNLFGDVIRFTIKFDVYKSVGLQMCDSLML